MSDLLSACENHYYGYSQLPLGSFSTKDHTHPTTGLGPHTIMTILVNDGRPNDGSHKLETFFFFKASTEDKDGLKRTGKFSELFDPWGNPYHLLLDYDYDKQLKDPFTGEIIKDKKVLIWSPGPDHKFGTPKTNKDNLYSWK